ncbi:MAG: LAGLIDADG family homing endonuclease [Candidatus Nanoarchaeia archaeon]
MPHCPKKLNNIPKYITENVVFLKAFIRGLFDMDGCVFIQKDRTYECRLIIATKFEKFAKSVSDSLSIRRINNHICKKTRKGIIDGYDV